MYSVRRVKVKEIFSFWNYIIRLLFHHHLLFSFRDSMKRVRTKLPFIIRVRARLRRGALQQ